MKEDGIIQHYLSYFGCLLFGVYVLDTLAPTLKNAGLFDGFLLAGAKTYTGALFGSCIYKLYFERQKCVYCNDGDSDSGNESD